MKDSFLIILVKIKNIAILIQRILNFPEMITNKLINYYKHSRSKKHFVDTLTKHKIEPTLF